LQHVSYILKYFHKFLYLRWEIDLNMVHGAGSDQYLSFAPVQILLSLWSHKFLVIITRNDSHCCLSILSLNVRIWTMVLMSKFSKVLLLTYLMLFSLDLSNTKLWQDWYIVFLKVSYYAAFNFKYFVTRPRKSILIL
jgi:hypothetical protein